MSAKRTFRTMSSDGGPSASPPKTFDSLQNKLAQPLLKGLRQMGFEYMTPVQQKVLTELPSLTSDCLVQAKTGTGKTAAFLLPALQNILQGNHPPKGQVAILVVCPTRELAEQIAKECNQITQFAPSPIECHTAYGGSGRGANLNKFLKGNPTVLVATPGRLNDYLGEEAVRARLQKVQTVVLDEADRMLDQGFQPQIRQILQSIPAKSTGWQGMCFSATLPPKVDEVVRCILSPGYTSLSTLDPNETPTADKVPQFSVVVPDVADQFTALYSLIQTEYKLSPDAFKAIVFGTTANGVAALYSLFSILFPQFQAFQLQSRMSQPARTRTTEDFKKAKAGILFASDVVGRGMDFPDVGLVVQVGLPSGEDQYIHRIGRTARAGKDGRATIILAENEAFFLKVNKKLPVQPYPEDIVSTLRTAQPQVDRAFNGVDDSTKAKAYLAWMGFNKMYLKKLQLDNVGLVKTANRLAAAMGCPEPPPVEKRTIGKMGLKGIPGLRFQQGESASTPKSRGPSRRNQGPPKEVNGKTAERRRKANAW